MATESGGKTIGFGTGTPEVGDPADIVLINWNETCNLPFYSPIELCVRMQWLIHSNSHVQWKITHTGPVYSRGT
jgi:hypothetical protein